MIASLSIPIDRLLSATTENADITDPARWPDILGIVCRVHHSPRFLAEAPLVPFADADPDFLAAKEEHFPNSWTQVGSHALRWEWRRRRPRMIVVRYCDDCRQEADAWTRNAHSNGE